ncbi:MAG: C10 family peptidase, partial [Candidatus Cloacimonetes bacterium]|nr:C10 family peptidase [Candidatus Cloacimonadota bacterium]
MKQVRITLLVAILLMCSNLLLANAERITSPLIMPVWHQTSPWNARCPGQGQNRAHAGSHALALAKTMKYWAYPNQGEGSVSYTDDDFGVLTQSFGQEINWGGMSNTLVFQTTQRFIYTCGLAAYTDYEYDFSSSSLQNVRSALINHFRYDSSMQILQRQDYGNFQWKNILRDELDNRRVVIYAATMADAREIAFIIDGYNEEGLFHINFSSAEIPDAWVEINDLSLLGETIPSSNQMMLSGIQPSLGPATISDNFEDGFGYYNWQFAGNTQWTISSEAFYYGSHSAKSGNIDHNQSTSMFIVIDVAEPDTISFFKRVSCESEPTHQYDHLAFFIDGVELQRWSGDGSWEYHEYPVSPGIHEFRWTYSKDGASVYYSDCAWVDAVTFPEGTTPLGAPLNLGGQTVNGNDINLNWELPDPPSPGLTGFRIYRNNAEIAQFANPTMTAYSDPNLPNGEYSYYLRALYSSGVSNPSNVLNLEVEVPYAPRNLSASVAGPTSILLSWQAPPLLRNRALLGFYLYRDGLVCAEIENPEATSYVDEGLSEGAYYYHVSALYDGAESALSNMAMAALGVPEPPVNLMATVEGSNVFLSWEQVQNTEMLSGFKVMRNGVEVGLIADPQQLSWADYGLANGNYSYAVRAVYGSIESGNSAAIEVVVRVPYSPVNLVGVVNADDVQLSWQMPELANDHTQYLIYRDGILIAGIFNPNIMIYTDLNLANGSYHYQVKAVYSGVESLPSEPAIVEVEVLYPPSNLSANEVEPGQVLLTWQAPPDSPSRGYLGTNLYVNGSLYGQIIAPGINSTQINLPGADYTFEIAAQYSSGESARISTFLAVQGWLEPVSQIEHSFDDDTVNLWWNPVLEPSAIYHLYRNGSLISQSTATSYSDPDLANGYYQYYIIVEHPRGLSDPSPALEIELEVLYPPTNLSALADGNSVQLTWQAPVISGGLNRGLVGYQIWRDDQALNTIPIAATEYLDSPLANGSYSYKVAAVYAGGTSDFSNIATAVVAVLYAPTNLTAIVDGATVLLNWQMPELPQSDFLNYRIYRNGLHIADSDQPQYLDGRVALGDHQYWVSAMYASGESAISNIVTAHLDYEYNSTIITGTTTGNQVDLLWSTLVPPQGIVLLGYELWRNGNLLIFTEGSTYSDMNLPNGEYSYYVKVIYDDAESIPSNTYSTTIEIPYPPQNLIAEVDAADVSLSWQEPVNGPRTLSTYQIYRDGMLIGQSSELSYVDSAVPNGSHTYHVTALYSIGGESPASNSVTVEVEVAYPPQNLQYLVSGDSVQLNWEAPVTAPRELLNYNIYRDGTLIGQSTDLQYTDSGLANGTYQYAVSAVYSAEESTLSNMVEAEIEVAYPPQNLSCTVSGASVSLLWELPATAPRALLGYQVYRDGALVGQSSELFFNDDGLANGSYSYHVTALYDSGESPASNIALAHIEVPYPPQNLQLTVTGNIVNLNWEVPASAPRALLHYNVYRNGSLIAQSAELSYIDSGLANGNHEYYVTALYDSGESIASNTVSAFVEVPYPPTQLSASVDEDNVLLSWNQPATSALRSFLGYYIYRNDILHQSLSNPTLTQWQDTGVPNGNYSYYLIARYDAGLSVASNTVEVVVNVMPDLFPPQNLIVSLSGERNALLSWTAPEGSPQFYRVYRNDQELSTTTTLSYLDQNLDNGTYVYYVKAQYAEGLSSASNSATLNLMVAYAPQSFSGTITNGNDISLSWAVPNQGEIGFVLHRNGTQYALINNPQTTSYSDPGLSNGSYSYSIAAIYPDAISDFSPVLSLAVEVLYPPMDFSLVQNSSTIDLSWAAPIDLGGFVAYKLYRNDALIYEGQQSNFSDIHVVNGNHEYSLAAVYSFGEIFHADVLSAAMEIAYAASNFSVSLQMDDALLSWTPSPDLGFFTTYRVYRNDALLASTPQNSYVDSDLANGSYSYYVIAEYSFGDAPSTAIVSVDLELLYPATNLTASVLDDDIQLSWNAPVTQGGLRALQWYMIYRNGAPYQSSVDTSFTDVDVDNGTYSYNILVAYDSGVSAPTDTVTVDLLYPHTPQDFSIYVENQRTVRLSWDPPNQSETGYLLYRNDVEIANISNSLIDQYIQYVVPNGTHTYRLVALYGDLQSQSTPELSADILYPYAPSNLDYTLNNNSAYLEWNPPTDLGGFSEYCIYLDNELWGVSNNPSYLAEDLPNGDNYIYVKARYGDLYSIPTNEVLIPIQIAYPVQNFSCDYDESMVSLSWDPPLDETGFMNYLVYRNDQLIETTWIEVELDFLMYNGDYSYYVVAQYEWGTSEPSPSYEVRRMVADYPRMLTGTVSGNDVTLTWLAPSDSVFLSYYNIYRDSELITQTTDTQYLDADLPNNVYIYLVTAVYDTLESPMVCLETVYVEVPQTPQNVSATIISDNNVQIVWSALSMDYGFMHYELYRNDALIYEGQSNVYVHYVPNGLHTYYVIARYQSSSSEPSESATVNVIVAQELQNVGHVVNGDSVTITWDLPIDTYGFSHVEVWRGTDLVGTVLPEDGNSYIDADIGNGHYFCHLRSVYEGGSFRVHSYDFIILVPYAPGNFQSSVEGHNVQLSWDPPSDIYYMTGYKLTCGDRIINLDWDAVSYLDEGLQVGDYNYSLQSVYEGPNHSEPQVLNVTIDQVYPAQAVTATQLEESFRIQWEAPLCLFAPDYYQIHLLPDGPDTPASEWILLDGNWTELIYVDSEHGGIEHGNFVWAVTAKWNNTSGGIPVLSNAIFVEKIPEYTRLVG